MNPQERNEFKNKWSSFQQKYENWYLPYIKKALQKQVRQFEETGDVNYITSEPIYKILKHLSDNIAVKWAHRTGIHRLKISEVKSLPMGFSERIVELMRQYYQTDLLNNAELMTSYSRMVIMRTLSANPTASHDDIVKILLDHPEFTEVRARRISRTETVTAANRGALANAKTSGIEMNKEWIAITDNRTRHSHLTADGKTVGIDESFVVDGQTMEYPGDRVQDNGLDTSAANVINCRCTLGYLPVRKNGKLVRTDSLRQPAV